jgi:hypothetical protein
MGSITISANYAGSGITVSEPPVLQSDSQNFIRVFTICVIFPVFGVLVPCNLVARSKLYEEYIASFFQGKLRKILILSSVYNQEYISDRKGNVLLVSPEKNQEDSVSVSRDRMNVLCVFSAESGRYCLCLQGNARNMLRVLIIE